MSQLPAIADLIAHEAPMILLDQLLSHDGEQATTSLAIHDDSPFLYEGQVPVYVSIEYMAQTVAVHAGLEERQAGGAPRVGYLIGARQIRFFHSGFFPGDALITRATCSYNDGQMGAYSCQVTCNGKLAAEGQINVFLPKINIER